MLRSIFHTVCIVSLFLVATQCLKGRWLVEGDIYGKEDVRNVNVESSEIYLFVDSNEEYTYNTKNQKRINGIIAAAVNMKGWVEVIDGGVKNQQVTFRYTTENGQPDTLYILIQSVQLDFVTVEGDIAQNSRYGIAYEPIKNWTSNGAGEVTSST